MAFSGVHVLPGAALAAITSVGSSGSSPVRLDGADSTAGAPGGGDGWVAPPGKAAATRTIAELAKPLSAHRRLPPTVLPRLIAPISEAGDRCPGSHLFCSYSTWRRIGPCIGTWRYGHPLMASHWGNDDHHVNLAVFVSPTSACLFTFSAIAAAELIAASRQGAGYDYFEAGMRDAPGRLVEPRRWKSADLPDTSRPGGPGQARPQMARFA